ncbi:family 43 glycosylhydrolase [Sphingobacterium sp. LRF_L2]|uniref:family 43 glycosylhydrolase n=1 Tax=Sphingobacterium sp. LRF_L2 TaxID=3369421 RepID=UPI003F600F8A
MITRDLIRILIVFLSSVGAYAQDVTRYDSPKTGNPIVPGYFADPTIKKIGDTYYLYATTDGNGGGFGPSQVWTSKDFVNWAIQPMNWPNTHWYWAPDMTKGYDGRYYLYYSQPVELFGAVSESPVGPWTSLVADDKAFVPNYMIPGVITLDGQTFTDDDGKIYMFWGTWGIYPDHGCAVGLLREDMKSFERIELIPNTIAKDYFEAPIMFKRHGVYYLLYSSGHCEDDTYRVQYVKSKVGPFGPYEYPKENPILVTNPDGTIHGPGHNGILEENGKIYIVYHRHNNPHSSGGFHRQVAADELLFDEDGNIQKIVPTHTGIGYLGKNTRPYTDLAFGKHAVASSAYSDDFKADFAIDNNNGTLWRAANNEGEAWLQVDLGKSSSIGTVLLEMEYPTYAYQYRIEVSADGKQWQLFSDNSTNDRWASPIIAHGKSKARYVRLTVSNTQVVGLPRGVWNMKVYKERLKQETIWSDPQPMPKLTAVSSKDIIRVDASSYKEGEVVDVIKNTGSLSGDWKALSPVVVKNYQGRSAFYFDGSGRLTSSFNVPAYLDGNASYTWSAWVNNPEVERIEPLFSWSRPGHDLTLATFGYGSDPARGAIQHGGWADMSFKQIPRENAWHHIVVTFDGYMERLYVDGKLEKEQNKMLFIRRDERFSIGGLGEDFFTGYISDLRGAAIAWTAEDVERIYNEEAHTGYLFDLETADCAFGEIDSLLVYGSALNVSNRIAVDKGNIVVADGRVGLSAQQIQVAPLIAMLQSSSFCVELDLFRREAWRHVVLQKLDGKVQVFEDGKITNTQSLDDYFSIRGNYISFGAAIVHAIRAHNMNLASEEISTLYAAWKRKCDGYLVAPDLLAGGDPYFLNNDNVFVAVKPLRNLVRYAFTLNKQASGWIKDPYYLFSADSAHSIINVLVKDVYGNVGKPVSLPVPPKHPVNMLEGRYDLPWELDSKFAFWDGLQLPVDRDSTWLSITRQGDDWRLASKDTKWGAEGWNGPFLYKELSGDFTVEIQVKDVAGLGTKARTSSEAGLMIQDVAHAGSYLNNTILTGWNLGNLVRSIGRGEYRELNTGAGLAFDAYLQIQKKDAYFYLRGSKDGKHWVNLPGSPFLRKDLNDKKLRVGIYQTANNNQLSYGTFGPMKIWKLNP